MTMTATVALLALVTIRTLGLGQCVAKPAGIPGYARPQYISYGNAANPSAEIQRMTGERYAGILSIIDGTFERWYYAASDYNDAITPQTPLNGVSHIPLTIRGLNTNGVSKRAFWPSTRHFYDEGLEDAQWQMLTRCDSVEMMCNFRMGSTVLTALYHSLSEWPAFGWRNAKPCDGHAAEYWDYRRATPLLNMLDRDETIGHCGIWTDDGVYKTSMAIWNGYDNHVTWGQYVPSISPIESMLWRIGVSPDTDITHDIFDGRGGRPRYTWRTLFTATAGAENALRWTSVTNYSQQLKKPVYTSTARLDRDYLGRMTHVLALMDESYSVPPELPAAHAKRTLYSQVEVPFAIENLQFEFDSISGEYTNLPYHCTWGNYTQTNKVAVTNLAYTASPRLRCDGCWRDATALGSYGYLEEGPQVLFERSALESMIEEAADAFGPTAGIRYNVNVEIRISEYYDERPYYVIFPSVYFAATDEPTPEDWVGPYEVMPRRVDFTRWLTFNRVEGYGYVTRSRETIMPTTDEIPTNGWPTSNLWATVELARIDAAVIASRASARQSQPLDTLLNSSATNYTIKYKSAFTDNDLTATRWSTDCQMRTQIVTRAGNEIANQYLALNGLLPDAADDVNAVPADIGWMKNLCDTKMRFRCDFLPTRSNLVAHVTKTFDDNFLVETDYEPTIDIGKYTTTYELDRRSDRVTGPTAIDLREAVLLRKRWSWRNLGMDAAQ